MLEYADLTDEAWFEQIAGCDKTPLFPLPDERTQTGTVGKSGGAALRDAFMFWQFCRRMLVEHGNGLSAETQVLDFGCAWGRIIRFWLRDLPPGNLMGADVEERFLSFAKAHINGPRFMLSQPRPPLDVPAGSVDLIYAMSVFSHLPRDVADAWVAEFSRILKPGGIACLTTRPRAHIEIAGTEASKGAHADDYARIITEKERALARYDTGKFVFYGAHGGGGLDADTYGEAIIPPAYAHRNWTKLDLVDFAENYSASYLQPCFVLRKPR